MTPVPTPKAAVQSVKRNDTKRLNWNTLSNVKVTRTLYAQEEFQESAALDADTQKELLEKFSNRPPPKMFDKETEEKKQEDETNSLKTAGILDQKRLTNVLIMLRKFDCTPKEIAGALKSLDPLAETLSLENVNALFQNSFKEEELEMAKNYAAPEEDISKLNDAEALAYYVVRVPRWKVKLQAMVTMRTAVEVEEEIRTSIASVTKASKEVLSSKRLQHVLAMILAIGNFLNAGTAKGAARGFKLETLTKLSETKTRDRGINLMHYITNLASKKAPDALLFPEDMPTVALAKRVAKEDVARELQTFQRAVAVLGREVTAVIKDEELGGDKRFSLPRTPPPPKSARRISNISDGNLSPPAQNRQGCSSKEPYRDLALEGSNEGNAAETEPKSVSALSVAKEMFTKAEAAVEELQKLHEEMLRTFLEVAVQLGEEPKTAKTEDVFSTLSQFIDAFTNSAKDNEKREEEAARQERLAKRQIEDEERRRKRRSSKGSSDNGSSPGRSWADRGQIGDSREPGSSLSPPKSVGFAEEVSNPKGTKGLIEPVVQR